MKTELLPLQRKWKIHLIHHTHTDIGYTDHQRKIERYQVEYLKHAIEIFEEASSGRRPEWNGFKWTVEAFWAVEQFLSVSSEEWRERLIRAVQGGGLEITGTYLHWTELIDQGLSIAAVAKICDFGRKAGVPVKSALACDVNGFGWGYADSLLRNGIENLMACVHSHHGLPPLGMRQIPFYWKSPAGGELLTWSGEHYMMGNFLGLMPRAVFDSCFKDEFTSHPLMEDNLPLAVTRLGRYLHQLEVDDYPYDFLPLGVAGVMVDNAPPNAEICEFIQRWNDLYGSSVDLQLSSPSEFFSEVRNEISDIPVFSGDWPDWWSDGVGSVPVETRVYRKAARDFRLLGRVGDLYGYVVPMPLMNKIRDGLTLFAEHTFSHNDSLIYPWNFGVQTVRGTKRALAYQCYEDVVRAWDGVFVEMGQGMHENRFPMHFKVINPGEVSCTQLVEFYFDYFQLGLVDKGARVIDCDTGEEVAYQTSKSRRGISLWIKPTLAPGEVKVFKVEATSATSRFRLRNFADLTPNDVAGAEANDCDGIEQTSNSFRTRHLEIRWHGEDGITALVDLASGQNLLMENPAHGMFTPVYIRGTDGDKTDGMDMFRMRSVLGRNRNSTNSDMQVGRLSSVKIVNDGLLFRELEFSYDIDGCEFYKVLVRVMVDEPRLEVSVRLHKKSVWQVENLYVSLPFALDQPSTALWLEKAGAWIRPGLDQLPDTLTDFYCMQDGFLIAEGDRATVVACADAPLLQLGPLQNGIRKLAGHPLPPPPRIYSWVMNNVWEVNFDPCLAGFHEFNYSVRMNVPVESSEAKLRQNQLLRGDLVSFQISSDVR